MIRPLRYLLTLPLVFGAGLLAHLMAPISDQANIAMVYLLGVVIAAFVLGLGPGVLAAVLSIVLFDFINVEPLYTLDRSIYRYSFTLLVMVVTAAIISRMAERLRQQATDSVDREARMATLYALSAELAEKTTQDAIIDSMRGHIAKAFRAEVNIFYPEPGSSLAALLPRTEINGFNDEQGLLTHASAQRVACAVPLTVDGVLFALVLVAAAPRWLGRQEQRHHLAAMLQQSAQAIERINLRQRIQQADLRMQKESLRNSILNIISHDLRTPLTAIIGASSTLVDDGENFAPESRLKLRTVIHEEAVQLLSMVENLLDMARLQGDDVQVAREWEAPEEIVGSAISIIRRRSMLHEIRVHMPHDLPLIRCDGVLLERVIFNLLENAIKYSPGGSAVTLSAALVDAHVQFTVEDQGSGIPEQQLDHVFDPFTRLQAGSGGSGLGLAICRRIVEAHGGRIWIRPRASGGACVEFILPAAARPPELVHEA